MKTRYLILLTTFLSAVPCFSQSGKVLESLQFKSAKLTYPVEYSVYLPADYETSQRSYPVLYLLHGYSGDETTWIQFGEANIIIDNGINKGDFPPCIIVMPDGKATFYCNSFDGKDPWEDMFIQEFIPFIEKEYRVRPKRDFRAIAGNSMGGNGALMLSMRHPELFSSCFAMSAGILTDEEILANDSTDVLFKSIFGPNPDGQVSEYWKACSPLHLLNSVDAKKLKPIRFYIDCGDDDFLYKGNSALHVKMRDMNIPHEYRVRNGGHDWEYWRTSLFDGLKFIAKTFHR